MKRDGFPFPHYEGGSISVSGSAVTICTSEDQLEVCDLYLHERLTFFERLKQTLTRGIGWLRELPSIALRRPAYSK